MLKKCLLFISLITLTACSSNPIDVSWQESSQTLPINFDKTLVMVNMETPANRRIAEEQFIAALPSIKGAASYRYLNDQDFSDVTAIQQQVTAAGFSHILLIRKVSEKTEWIERPQMQLAFGHHRAFRNFNNSVMWQTSSLESREKVLFEISLFQLPDHTLLWTGNGQLIEPTNIHAITQQLSQGIQTKWQEDGIIPANK